MLFLWNAVVAEGAGERVLALRAGLDVRLLSLFDGGVGLLEPASDLFTSALCFGSEIDFGKEANIVAATRINEGVVNMS